MEVNSDSKDVLVTLSGDLCLLDALNLKLKLPDLIESGKCFTIDLTEVKNVDLTGLNALLMTKVVCDQNGVEATIIAGKDHPIFELLHLTKFKNQFSFRNVISEAPALVAC